MTARELATVHRRKPFEPFRIVLTDGRRFDIRHSNLLLVGKTQCQVGVNRTGSGPIADHFVTVAADQILAVEPLATAGSAEK